MMEAILENRCFRLVAYGLWLVACGLWLVGCKEDIKGSREVSKEVSKEVSLMMPCTQLPSCIANIKSLLVRQVIAKKGENKISFSELSDYDLATFEIKKSIQDAMNLFPNSEDKNFILTVSNRVHDAGTNFPDLLALITNLSFENCMEIVRQSEGEKRIGKDVSIPHSVPPNLLPYPKVSEDKDVVTLPSSSSVFGCVEAEDLFYYYQVIYEF